MPLDLMLASGLRGLKNLASTAASAPPDQSQTAQDGLDCRCSPPSAWDISASPLPEHNQDSDRVAQTSTPESVHVRSVSLQKPRASLTRASCVDESDDDGDYEIDACDGSRDDDGDAEDSTEYDIRFECSTHGDPGSEGERYQCGRATVDDISLPMASDADALTTALGRAFVRKRAKLDQAHDCCDRCKSNLNGKLIIGCGFCSFRRHLYCFTPPLKQHPAFLEQVHVTALGTKVRARPTTDAITNWACDACRQRGHSSQLLGQVCDLRRSHERTGRRRALIKKHGCRERPEHDIRHQNIVCVPEVSARPARSSDHEAPKDLSPVQEQWRVGDVHQFDWFAFRAEKVKRIALQINTDGISSDELVYYSKPFVDMKRTVLDWMDRVKQKKQLERSRFQREIKKRPPPKRDVMHRLTEAEQEQLARALLSRRLTAHDERRLFDDTLTYHFDISASRIRRLREARASVTSSTPAVADDADSVARILSELAEAVCMDLDDVDARSLALTNSADPALNTSQVKWAAIIVQSAVIRKAYTAKQRVRAQHLQIALVEDQRIRKAIARGSLRVLRLCVMFTMLSVRNLRNAQMKKLLLQTLQEASEDAKVADATEDEADRREKLAEKRIQRFFMQRVRRYVFLKKKVMSRRIRLWWRRRRVLWKWRDTAIALRDRRRSRASQAIQVAYRRYRAKKVFQEILEKHAVRRVKLFLRSWLMSRVINKEKVRVEIYTIAASIGVISDESLPELAHATLDKILCALGMGLYIAGDFWNAASVLDRVRKLNSSSFNWEAQLALAYSHHMTWYSSYDRYNLQTAYDTYCIVLNDISQRAGKAGMSDVDPFILQDTAIVMMQLENFGGSLRLLASLIQFFVQSESFPLWLLLAAVQLQQRGEWKQSVEYLTYLQDIPPSPYLERDILCLCAISLEHQKRDAGTRVASREAWSAAHRQWNLEQKEKLVLQNESAGSNPWSRSGEDVVSSKTLAHGTLWKWAVLNDFAQRAIAQGHYLLACRLILHMLEIRPEYNDDTEEDRSERAAVWWTLADVFRHLGHIDLYVDATMRSHQSVEASAFSDDQERITEWRREAEAQARSFISDTETIPTIEFTRKLRAQYCTRSRG